MAVGDLLTGGIGTGTASDLLMTGLTSGKLIPEPQQSVSIPAPQYAFYIRDAQTLERLARVHWITSANWTRRLYAEGGGEVRINDAVIDSSLLVNAGYEPQEHLFEIVRDGEPEFLGIIDEVSYDSESGNWTARMVDALDWWLATRETWPPPGQDSDNQEDVPAGNAILHYVSRHLTSPSIASRDIDNDLFGVTFSLSPASGAGDDVSAYSRYENLAVLVRRLAREGNVVLRLSLSASGYVFSATEPDDRTAGQPDAVVFSTGRRTAIRVTPTASRRGAVNVLRLLSNGEGQVRGAVAVDDDADLATHARREGSHDVSADDVLPRLFRAGPAPSTGDTVTIGSITYTFDADWNTPESTAFLVRSDPSDPPIALALLKMAINAQDDPDPGKRYGSETTPHPDVRAEYDGESLILRPISNRVIGLATTVPEWDWSMSSFDPAAYLRAGEQALAERSGTQFTVEIEPDPGNAPYRESWDLGDIVTAVLPPVDVAVDQQIIEVSVSLDDRQGEVVSIVTGEPVRDLLGIVDDLDRNIRRVARR